MNNIEKDIESMINNQDVSDYFNLGWDTSSNVYQLDQQIKNKYQKYNYPTGILTEIDINTRLKNEYILKDKKFDRDAEELEKYRVFRKGFLRNKGVFYCEGINFISEFELLGYSIFRNITNGAFNGRYCLPICLPNGDVFTWMTYDPSAEYKYMLPKAIGRPELNYFHQGNILGNLESLRNKNTNKIYFSEGMFDAYRIEEQFNSSSVALLGSKLGTNKIKMLKLIKMYTRKELIYVPDIDSAGLSNQLIKNPIWDDVFNYSKEFGTKCKDIDLYFREKIIKERGGDINNGK